MTRPSTSLGTSEALGSSAAQLAGLAGMLFGWRPDDFWAATPAELAVLFAALRPPGTAPATGATLAELKERFPDG